MKLFKKLNKGFTLVELVVVIAVIAILSAVSVVAYTGITKNSKRTTAISEARSLFTEKYSEDLLDGAIDGKNGNAYVAMYAEEAFVDNGEGYHYKEGAEKEVWYEHTKDGEFKVLYYADGTSSVTEL